MSDLYNQQPVFPQAGPPAPAPAHGSNGLATAGFVLALLGFLGSWIPVLNIVCMVLAIIGAILAAVGLAKSTRVGTGKGLAIAGLILGVLAVVIAVVVNVAFVDAVDEAVDETTNTSVEAPADSDDEPASDDEAIPDDEAAPDDEELGTTRDNPAPLGSVITGDDWTVTINSVKTADEDSIGQKPAAGSTLLVINLTATYTGDDEQGDSAWASVKFVTADGTTIDSTSGSTLFLADGSFDSLKTVYNGASIKGNEMLEVPAENWQDGVLAVSPSLMSDDTFVAVK